MSSTTHMQPITQVRMDYIVRKLGLLQRQSEELASFLKESNLLAKGVNVSGYRRRQA